MVHGNIWTGLKAVGFCGNWHNFPFGSVLVHHILSLDNLFAIPIGRFPTEESKYWNCVFR